MPLMQCRQCEKVFDTTLIPEGGLLLCTYCGFDNTRTVPGPAPQNAFPVPTPPPLAAAIPASAPPPPGERVPCEWERDWTSAPLRAYVNTFRDVLSSPVKYFATLKPFDDYLSLMVLIYINGFIGVAAAMALNFAFNFVPMAYIEQETALIGGLAALPFMICGSVIVPFIGILGTVILAGVQHFFLKFIGGSQKNFETTLSVNALQSYVNIFQIVPIVGGLASSVYVFIIGIGGQAEAHEIEGVKALLAFIMPMLICCCCILGAIVAAGGLAGILNS